jgi:alkylated DNA repair protein alkB homolog 1
MSESAPLLDAHRAPPHGLKELYKRYQKLNIDDLDSDSKILDFEKYQPPDDVEVLEPIKSSHLTSIFSRFAAEENGNLSMLQDAPIYRHKTMPGRYFSFS